MGLDYHTTSLPGGSDQPVDSARIFYGFNIDLATPAGNGDPASIGAGTSGVGYATIPTVSFTTNGDPTAIGAGTPGIGYQQIPEVLLNKTGGGYGAAPTALMGLEASPLLTTTAGVAAGGSGGTPGAATLTGTTGTGTPFQVAATIGAGGNVTAIGAVSVAGSYSVLPTNLQAEPVTGGGLTGCLLNLQACFGVIGYTATHTASNGQYAQGTTASLVGGNPTTAAVPGAVTITNGTGNGSGATATAVMGVEALPTITAGGTGGTPGAVTLTGTDGTGTKFQVTGTISGGGVLTSLSAVTVKGAYTALPGTLSAGAVSGGSLTGCTLNLTACFGVVSYTVAGSSDHNYGAGTGAAVSGGTPTTPAVPGAVPITSVAGQGCTLGLVRSLPPKYAVFARAGDDRRIYVTKKTTFGFTLNFLPGLSSATLAAETTDILVCH